MGTNRYYMKTLGLIGVKLTLLGLIRTTSTGKNNGIPILDIFGYPKFGRVRQIPIWELGWEFPDWDLSHFTKFGIFVGIL